SSHSSFRMQITNFPESADRFIVLIQTTFDLQLLFANAMRFIPMEFNESYRTIGKPHGCNAFQLAPTPGTNCLRGRERSRTEGPRAIVCTSVSSPTISKYIHASCHCSRGIRPTQ